MSGDRVALHVSTTPAASYRVLVYRIGWYHAVGGFAFNAMTAP